MQLFGKTTTAAPFAFDLHKDELLTHTVIIAPTGGGMSIAGFAERQARQKEIDFARASVGLEGFTLSPEVEAINQRYIDGELSGEEHIAAIRAAVMRG